MTTRNANAAVFSLASDEDIAESIAFIDALVASGVIERNCEDGDGPLTERRPSIFEDIFTETEADVAPETLRSEVA